MRKVTCSMGVSLDGYIVGPDGSFACSAPDEEVFRFATDEVRQVGVHLLGRRLYETMSYWDTADQDPSLTDLEREFASLWVSLPEGGVLPDVVSCLGEQSPRHGRPGGGGRQVASGARAGRHRHRRRDTGCGSGRVGPDRRVRTAGPSGAGRWWNTLLPQDGAPGRSRARRQPHVRLRGRVPPLPHGALSPSGPAGQFRLWASPSSEFRTALSCSASTGVTGTSSP